MQVVSYLQPYGAQVRDGPNLNLRLDSPFPWDSVAENARSGQCASSSYTSYAYNRVLYIFNLNILRCIRLSVVTSKELVPRLSVLRIGDYQY